MMQVVEYLDTTGQSVFAAWFDRLDPQSAAKVTVALQRLRRGNLSNMKGVGGGVLAYRVDFWPGYRLYSDAMGNRSSCCRQVERSDVSSRISKPHQRTGPNTGAARRKCRDGAHEGFQSNR
jgi:putative addiction module killer protein